MKKIILAIALLLALVIIASANTNTTLPSVGVYWKTPADPTGGTGVSAPVGQILFRTDVPSIYFKSGSGNTQWTLLGTVSTGTLSQITAGQSITVSGGTGPTATVALNFPTTACSSGSAITAHSSSGAPTCNAFLNAAGTSLSSSGSTVNLNFPTTACSSGSAITSHSSSGAPTCGAFVNAAGTSLSLSGSTMSLDFPTTACTSGKAITSHSATGAPTCTTFIDGAGPGLVQAGSTLAANLSGASCSAGQAVTAISSSGGGTCTTFVNAAGTGLSASGSTLNLNITPTSCSAGQTVTAISSAGVGTCTALTSSGSLSSASSGTWTTGVNLTTEGTIDWASWDQAMLNGSNSGVAYTVRQSMTQSGGPKGDRFYDGLKCSCAGTTGCNGAALCAQATAGTGGGRSTTTGANNYAAAAQATSLTGPFSNPTSTGYYDTITVHMFPGETGTIHIYLKLVDISVSWTADLYENGVSVSQATGSWTSLSNATTDALASFAFTIGTVDESTIVFKVTNTARGATNPRLYVFGATMF